MEMVPQKRRRRRPARSDFRVEEIQIPLHGFRFRTWNAEILRQSGFREKSGHILPMEMKPAVRPFPFPVAIVMSRRFFPETQGSGRIPFPVSSELDPYGIVEEHQQPVARAARTVHNARPHRFEFSDAHDHDSSRRQSVRRFHVTVFHHGKITFDKRTIIYAM
ncbi:hypothetical protein SDC9_199358 [bioreactor metagenome]|uniref:Uncharacterized protein n=1 Tax=bioreactor metagenome TaxID=1076179 RepID=A0A645IMK8_9ZZZZ